MKTLCPKCYSSQVIPATVASPDFPQSLEPTLLSPSVLGSIGMSVCKKTTAPPSFGLVVGTLVGLALTHLKQKGGVTYYCRTCNQVFENETRYSPSLPQSTSLNSSK